jgi:hypothetical protein
MRKRLLSFVAAMAVLGFAAPAVAEDPEPKPAPTTGTVKGRATGYAGDHPLAVEVIGLGRGKWSGPAGPTDLDEDGRFVFTDVDPGTYRFVVYEKKDGDQERVRRDATVKAGATTHLVFSFGAEEPEPEPEPCFTGEVRYWSGADPPDAFAFRLEREDGEGEGLLIEGKDGRFEFALPEPGKYVIRSVRIGGRQHPVMERVWIREGTIAHAIHIRVHELLEAQVLVMDAQSGRPVPDARIFRYRGSRGFDTGTDSWGIPPPETLRHDAVRADDAGRATVWAPRGPMSGNVAFAVVADGHAWSIVSVRMGEETPRSVRLRPGGQLGLRIERYGELENPVIKIWPESGAGLSDPGELGVPDENGYLLVEGLRPDSYHVSVERRAKSTQGRVYGRGEALVLAGKTVGLVVQAKPAVRRKPVTFRGVLHGAEAWGKRLEWISLAGGDPDNSDVQAKVELGEPGKDGGIAFEVKSLLPGLYNALVQPIGWRQSVRVTGVEGALHISLGEPATVRLRVVDAATGKDLSDATAWWHLELETLTAYRLDEAERDVATGRLTFLCGAGHVEIDVQAEGHIKADLELDTKSGETIERTVRLHRAGAVRVQLVVEGKPFDTRPAAVRLTRETHDSRRSWNFRGSGAVLCKDLPPGVVELTIRDIDGFEPVPPRQVRIEPGKTLDVTIELVRKP